MKKLLLTLATLSILACPLQAADVKLEWDASPTPGITEYRLYEETSAGWVLVGTVPGTSTVITLPNVQPGVHTYVVTAANEWGESPQSNAVSTAPVPVAPAGLKVTVIISITSSVPAGGDQ